MKGFSFSFLRTRTTEQIHCLPVDFTSWKDFHFLLLFIFFPSSVYYLQTNHPRDYVVSIIFLCLVLATRTWWWLWCTRSSSSTSTSWRAETKKTEDILLTILLSYLPVVAGWWLWSLQGGGQGDVVVQTSRCKGEKS